MKNSRNNIPDISSDNLASGELTSWVPELYAQKNVIAINPWHDHQSIFDHTVAVLSSAQHILTFPFVEEKLKDKLSSLLLKNIDGAPRRSIILTVALLHDVGCKKSMITDSSTGQTDCPKHEVIGRDMSIVICKRWGLSDALTGRISKIVLRHLDVHRAINESLASGKEEEVFNTFHQNVGDIYLELLIQGYADTAGSDLPILQPKQYLFRENMYREEIIRFASSL